MHTLACERTRLHIPLHMDGQVLAGGQQEPSTRISGAVGLLQGTGASLTPPGARRARALPQVGCRGCQGHLSASALSSPLAVCFPRPAPSRRAEASERRPTATFRLLQRPFPRSAIPWPRLKAGPTMRYCARLLGGEAAAGAKTRLPGRGGEGGGRAHAHQHPNALLGSWGSWMVPKIPHPGVGMLPEMLPRPLPCSILLGERGG